jgi:hypothetical protein
MERRHRFRRYGTGDLSEIPKSGGQVMRLREGLQAALQRRSRYIEPCCGTPRLEAPNPQCCDAAQETREFRPLIPRWREKCDRIKNSLEGLCDA